MNEPAVQHDERTIDGFLRVGSGRRKVEFAVRGHGQHEGQIRCSIAGYVHGGCFANAEGFGATSGDAFLRATALYREVES